MTARGSMLLALVIFALAPFDPAWARRNPGSVDQAKSDPRPVLTLQTAIDRALASSPAMRSATASVAAAQGVEHQAGLLPNPELAIDVENFAGSGSNRGFDSAELTYGVSQTIEIGGKRSARQDAARAERHAVEFAADAAKLDLIRDVTTAYVAAAAAEQSFALAEELEQIAQRVLSDAKRRVRAAREPLIQETRAQVALTTSAIARERAANTRDTTRRALSRFWGADFAERIALDDFLSTPAPASLETYQSRLVDAPDVARLKRLGEARLADLRLARAAVLPDPRITAGVRQFRDSDETAFVAGISLPIPVFNQNQGEIDRSAAEVTRAQSDAQQSALDRAQQLSEAWAEWQSTWQEATSLTNDVLPLAEKAFRLALEGYEAGRFAYLDVLDAQRTLFEARSSRVETLARLHTSRAQVERLVSSTAKASR